MVLEKIAELKSRVDLIEKRIRQFRARVELDLGETREEIEDWEYCRETYDKFYNPCATKEEMKENVFEPKIPVFVKDPEIVNDPQIITFDPRAC